MPVIRQKAVGMFMFREWGDGTQQFLPGVIWDYDIGGHRGYYMLERVVRLNSARPHWCVVCRDNDGEGLYPPSVFGPFERAADGLAVLHTFCALKGWELSRSWKR